MKLSSRFIFGIIVIFLGILLLLEQATLFPSISSMIWTYIWKFWPLILIFFGAKLLIDRANFPGFILLILGVVFLSTNLFGWDFLSVLWPVVLIAIGISILLRDDTGYMKKGSTSSKSTSKDYHSESVVFWGSERKIKSKEFKGGEYNVAFGGLELDLREAKIAKGGAKIHVNCAFGGVEIFVPKDCRVKTRGSAFLGAWEPNVEESDVDEPVLEITGGVAFGGVEIK